MAIWRGENSQQHVKGTAPRLSGSVILWLKDQQSVLPPWFIDAKTTSLDNPELIDLCIRNINGIIYHNRFKPQKTVISDSAYTIHKISVVDLIDAPVYTEEESKILSILNGKRIVSYNLEFDCKALLFSSANPKMIQKYKEVEKNGICLMSAIKFKLKRFKALCFVDACTQFEVPLSAVHAPTNDTLMLINLYEKFRRVLISNPNEWLPNFIDIPDYHHDSALQDYT